MHDNPRQTARESQTCTTRPTEATEGPTEEEAEEDYRITPRDWVLLHLLSIYGLCLRFCELCDRPRTWRNLRQDDISRLTKEGHEHAKAVVTNCYYFQFPGQGQKSTPCMTLRGLQRLLMILGGKVAAEFREIVEGVFTRYVAGDTSLIEEVRDNAAVQLRV